MLLKDQKVKRPAKTKIYKRDNDRYVYYVYEVYKKVGAVYPSEKRVCIGKMIDNEMMIPNDQFEKYCPNIEIEKNALPPTFSDAIDVGSHTLIDTIINTTYISDILDETFGSKSSLIKDLISYILVSESCTFEYFPYYARKSVLYSDRIYSDAAISKLLKDEISLTQIEQFINEWNKQNKDINDVYINVDSTNFNVLSDYEGLSDYGYAKDKSKPQVNLSYLSSADTHRPLAYELYNGSITDTGEITHLLNAFNKYDYKNIGFIFDRGYYSIELVKRLQKEKRFFIMMLKENYEYVQEIIKNNTSAFINEVDNYISEYEVSYVSKKTNISKNKKQSVCVNVHVYYDCQKAASQKAMFLNVIEDMEKNINKIYKEKLAATREDLVKYENYFEFEYSDGGNLLSFKKNKKAIIDECKTFGYFALLSSKDISAKEVLCTYRTRDSIEKLFRALKSSFDFTTTKVYYKSSLESKVFITFLAMIVRNEIAIELRKLSIQERKLYTVPFVMKELASIEASKNVDGKYSRRYALTAKQKKILDFYKLKEKDIETTISNINEKTNI